MTPDAPRRAARVLLLQALAALSLSALLAVSLRASVNPVPGQAGYEVAAWLRDLLRLAGAGLLVAALALRALARG